MSGSRAELNGQMCRLAAGDRSAFSPVFRGVFAVASSLARRMLGNPADAEDATQQAMLKLFAQASAFDPQGDVLSWALALTAWEARTLLKRRAREKRRAGGEPSKDSPSVGPSPEDLAITAQLFMEAEKLLGSLSNEDRRTLETAFSGAADPSARFRKRKQRALDRLRLTWKAIHG